MKTEKFSGTIENAYGQTLPNAVKFEGSYEAYENIDEIKAANDMPNNDEIVSFVNARRKANKRQQAMTAALDAAGIQKPTDENPEVALKNMVKILKAQGKTDAQAEQIAKSVLGIA
jgi:hypothetical protein